MDWLFDRLTERSTWAGVITAVGTICGVAIKPELAVQITGAGVAIASLALFIVKEKAS